MLIKIKVLLGPSTFCEHDQTPIVFLKQHGFELIANPYKRKLTKDETVALLSDGVTGIIAGLEELDRDVLSKTKLKVISRSGSGMSNVDVEFAKSLGIKVYSTPQAPVNAVAELTIGALLSLARNISFTDNQLHQGKWDKKIGFELAGKKIAIIGFGRIGRQVAKLIKNFSVEIMAVDPGLTGIVDGVKIVSMPEAVSAADIITIHMSGDKEVLGEKEFDMMKKGVILLNGARGGLINETALVQALDSSKVRSGWLDVFSKEPYNGPLINYPQLLLTSHIGSYTLECRKNMEMEAAQNLVKGFEI